MTIDGNSGDDRSSTSQSAEALGLSMRLSQTLEIGDETAQDQNQAPPEGATCNGCVTQSDPPSHSGNLNNIRRTLAKWLRLQRPKPNETKLPRQRHRLIGWPPSWRRRRRSSPDPNPCGQRALPPVPPVPPLDQNVEEERVSTPEMRPEDFPPGVAYLPDGEDDDEETNFEHHSGIIDFAASIETVKNCDWYWGPICGTAAEQVLSNEPDGSFLVRDSSDDRYIFSLTFKLNGTVRHVRIEHDQGNFSFGSFTRFKSNTIVDFVENAVEHSRSGRYLFFLNRRPTNGPMRVQLLHPVSRVKQVQSLQHMCRFVILKLVPRDHVEQLPVPKRIKEYLNTPNYYSENIEEPEEEEVPTTPIANGVDAIITDNDIGAQDQDENLYANREQRQTQM